MLSFEYIQIEPTFNCNLLCKHCGRTRQFVGKEMSLDNLRFVLDQFQDYKLDHIAFNGGGEIFTHKKVEEMFSLITKRGYKISTVSNGTLLHKKNMEFIIKNGLLYHMILSIEGATQATFDSIRGKNTFDVFTKNIQTTQELKKKWQIDFPIITLNVVCMKANLKELPLIVDFAIKYDIKELIFVHLNPLVQTSPQMINEKLCVPDQHLSKCDRKVVQEVFKEIREKTDKGNFDLVKIAGIDFNGSGLQRKPSSKKAYCPWVDKRTFINWEGFVIPCCQVGRRDLHFGNIFRENFKDIWESKEYTDFRENLLSGGTPHPLCKNCNEYRGIGFG